MKNETVMYFTAWTFSKTVVVAVGLILKRAQKNVIMEDLKWCEQWNAPQRP
jgi:hypothetical protein